MGESDEHHAQPGATPFADPTEPAAFAQTLAGLGTEHVLVVVPRTWSDQARRALTLTTARWPELKIARIVSDHSPLALVETLSAGQASVRDPGAAVAFVHAALGSIWSGVWTPSVWGLDQPARSRDRLRSLLPGGSFVVSKAPRVAVHAVARGARFPLPPALSGVATSLITQAPGLAPTVADRLARDLAAASVRQVALTGGWRGVAESRRAVQLALMPSDMHRVRPAPPVFECRCGVRSIESMCPFCRVVSRPLVRMGATA